MSRYTNTHKTVHVDEIKWQQEGTQNKRLWSDFGRFNEKIKSCLLLKTYYMPQLFTFSCYISNRMELQKNHICLHIQEETRRRALTDAVYLQGVLLEVQRLWPPFIGGRRIADQVGFPVSPTIAIKGFFLSSVLNLRDPVSFLLTCLK